MEKYRNYIFMTVPAVLLGLMFSNCSVEKKEAPTRLPARVSGVAAVGAPVDGTVFLRDSSIPAREIATKTARNGSFSLVVAGLKSPYMLKAEWNDRSGHNHLYSVATREGRTNINPLSDSAVSGAAEGDDPDDLYDRPDPERDHRTSKNFRSIIDGLRTVLAPLFALYQTPGDPVSDECEADHTGLDALFDDVRIEVAAGIVTVTNKITGRVIYTGPVDDLASGTFYAENMPAGPGGPDGPALYEANCSSCHGALAASEKQGATAARIQSAVAVDAGGMGGLSYLTALEIQAIATALSSSAGTPPPAPQDGAALYDAKCSSCHGALASSNMTGATAENILAAITADVSGMGSLANLTNEEIQAIADALAPATLPPSPAPPADGSTLYADNCASCHDPLASSAKAGAAASLIESAIANNLGGMGSLAGLTTEEVRAIADVLALVSPPPSPPADGSTLYADNCASCHGPLASSTEAGAAASLIESAIANNLGGMGSLAGLTTEEVRAIADVLALTDPPPAPIDGATLYADHCSSCHGSLASSGVRGATAARIESAIADNRGGMGYLTGLTSLEIQSVATALSQ